MHKGYLLTAAGLGALAVVLGAFGAHALKKIATDQQLTTFETGVRYLFYHLFALALTALLFKDYPTAGVVLSGKLFIVGMILFSGSLFLLTGFSVSGFQQFRWIGAITPIGGLCLIVAWLNLAFSIYSYKR